MNFGNLGIALGAGVDEWNNQRKLAREDAREAREAEQFGWQREQQARQKKVQGDQDAIMEEARRAAGYINELNTIPDDKLGEFASRMVQTYNTHPAYQNGLFANIAEVDGKPMIVHGNMAKLGGVQMIPVSREHMASALEQMNGDLRRRLAMTDPSQFAQYTDKEREFGLKGREIGTKEEGNRIAAEHYRRSDDTMERYRADQGRLLDEQIRTGNWGAVGLNASHARYFDRMPRDGGSGGSGGAANKWVPLANDVDGSPVFFNSAVFDPAKPGSGLSRADGKPIQDIQKIYRKFTGEQDPKAPKPTFTDPLKGEEYLRSAIPGFDKLPPVAQNEYRAQVGLPTFGPIGVQKRPPPGSQAVVPQFAEDAPANPDAASQAAAIEYLKSLNRGQPRPAMRLGNSAFDMGYGTIMPPR